MLVVFNPLNTPVSRTIRVNLYYTGLTEEAQVHEQEGTARPYKLARDFTIDVPVAIGPQGFAWFVIE
jgi:hypothetical protein